MKDGREQSENKPSDGLFRFARRTRRRDPRDPLAFAPKWARDPERHSYAFHSVRRNVATVENIEVAEAIRDLGGRMTPQSVYFSSTLDRTFGELAVEQSGLDLQRSAEYRDV